MTKPDLEPTAFLEKYAISQRRSSSRGRVVGLFPQPIGRFLTGYNGWLPIRS